MIFHVILALSMLKDDREDQSIMLIFGKKKNKKNFTDKKMAFNYTGLLQSCCFFLLLYFLHYAEIAFTQHFFDSCEISYSQSTS